MVSSLTVRVCVDGFHKLSVGRVQSVEGVSSFKHGSGWVEACQTGVAPKPHHCYNIMLFIIYRRRNVAYFRGRTSDYSTPGTAPVFTGWLSWTGRWR